MKPSSLTRRLPDTRKVEPPHLHLSAAERNLNAQPPPPAAIHRRLSELAYNTESAGDTMRGFRGVVRTRTAQCLEAALFTATVLEQHRYPPLILGVESIDLLDHVIFVYRSRTGWGAGRRSPDPGRAA